MNEFKLRFHKNDIGEVTRVSLDIVDFHYFCHKGATKQVEPFKGAIKLLETLEDYDEVLMKLEDSDEE